MVSECVMDSPKGFILVHRSIRGHWVWKNPYAKAWIDMIMDVNHKPRSVEIRGSVYRCERGQSLNSIATWTNAFGKGWTTEKTRTFLRNLENDGMIHTENLGKTTRLTICNYDAYQGCAQGQPKQEPKVSPKSAQGQPKVSPTNNNGNNGNNGKKDARKGAGRPVSIDDVMAYITTLGYPVDAQKWWDHYESNGWKVGRNPMKNWHAAVRKWKPDGWENGSKVDDELEMAPDSAYLALVNDERRELGKPELTMDEYKVMFGKGAS